MNDMMCMYILQTLQHLFENEDILVEGHLFLLFNDLTEVLARYVFQDEGVAIIVLEKFVHFAN